MRFQRLALALTVSALAILPLASASFAAEKKAQATASAVDPAAVAAAERMGAYLRTLQSFQITSTGILEEALDNGKKVSTKVSTSYKVRRPDAFVVEMTTDKKSRRFIYDGKSFTVFAPKVGYFATVSAPPTIDEAVGAIYDEYGIVLPLADIFYWGTDAEPIDTVTSARHVGTETISGVKTDHYAFAGDAVGWDIWIQQGDTPLPRKMIITTLDDPLKPTYSASLYWMTQLAFAPETFTFSPTADAKPIEMASVEK